jgi:hypothetical protein
MADILHALFLRCPQLAVPARQQAVWPLFAEGERKDFRSKFCSDAVCFFVPPVFVESFVLCHAYTQNP